MHIIIKKKEAALALALIGFVSTVCLKGMVAVSRKIEEKKKNNILREETELERLFFLPCRRLQTKR